MVISLVSLRQSPWRALSCSKLKDEKVSNFIWGVCWGVGVGGGLVGVGLPYHTIPYHGRTTIAFFTTRTVGQLSISSIDLYFYRFSMTLD